MKKQFLTTMAIAACGMMLTSCSDDFAPDFPGGDGITYRVQLPGEMTRAIGDGLSANTLKYAVYSAESGEYVTEGTASFATGELSTTISLTGEKALVNGQSYKIAFFAYNVSNSVYSIDTKDATVTVNYENMKQGSSSKDYDCFYALDEFTVTGAMSRDVILTRPMAQLNFGTDDYDTSNDFVNNAYGTSLRCNLVGTAHNVLNLLTGEPTESTTSIKVSDNLRPLSSSCGEFPAGPQYRWLTSTYILTPEGNTLMDLKFETYRTSTLVNSFDVTNVPLERNYRTNIYGSLLTASADFTISKSPMWDDDVNVPVWRGEVKMPVADAAGNYTITSAAELAGLAKMVNAGDNLKGKTVTLATDLDLANISWTPVGTDAKPFDGYFDGGNHTVKNLYVSLKGKPYTQTGLFGAVNGGGWVKNLTIDGAKVDATGYVGSTGGIGNAVVVGKLYTGKCVDNVTVRNAELKSYRHAGLICGHAYGVVTNCTVENSSLIASFEPMGDGKYDNGDKIGGILGYAAESGGGTYLHTGNKVINTQIEGYRHVGALFGYIGGGTQYTDNSATNCVITQTLDHNYNNIEAGTLIGKITGWTINNGAPDNASDTNVAVNVEIRYPQAVSTPLEAVQILMNGGIVEASADLDFTSLPGSLEITKPSAIIVPEGVTVTLNNGQLKNSSELLIKGGGTFVSTGEVVQNQAGGVCVIEEGVFKGATSANQNVIRNEGEMVINGGTFEVTATSGSNYALLVRNAKSTVVNGGTFISSNAYGTNITGFGDVNSPSTVVINDGVFIGKHGAAMTSGSVDLTINGGYFLTDGLYHGFYNNPESMYDPSLTRTTINGGYFHGGNGYAIGGKTGSPLVVKGGYVNKTSGFTPADGFQCVAASKSVTAGGKTWNFTHQVVKK